MTANGPVTPPAVPPEESTANELGRPTHSRTTTSVLYVALSYLSVVFVIIQGLLLVPLYLKNIDENLYGAWLATGGVLAYLSLLDLGFTAVVRQQVAEAYGNRDRKRIGEVTGTGLVVTACLSLVVIAVGALLAQWLPGWIGMTGADADTLRTAILIASVANGLAVFAYSLSDVAVGLQRVTAINTLDLAAWSVGIVVTVLTLTNGWGLLAIPFGYLVRTSIYATSLAVNLVLIWIKTRLDRPAFRRHQLHFLGGMVSYTFLGRVADTIVLRTDEIIVAKVMGTAIVPIFAFTSRAEDLVNTFPDRLSFALVPTMAHLYGEQGIEKTRQRSIQAISLIFSITVASAAAIIALNQSFVTLWVGPQYFGGVVLTLTICLQFVLITSRRLLSRLLFAIAIVDVPNRLLLLEAGLRIPLAIFLTMKLGLIGIPIAGIIALLLANGVFLTREFGRKMRVDLGDFRSRWPALLLYPLAAFAIGVGWMVLEVAQTWQQFVAQAIVVCLLLGGLMWLLNGDTRAMVRQLVTQLYRRLLRSRSTAE